MSRPFSLTDDDLNDLERVRDSLALVRELAHHANDVGLYKPQLLAAFLDGISTDLNRVISSAIAPTSRR